MTQDLVKSTIYLLNMIYPFQIGFEDANRGKPKRMQKKLFEVEGRSSVSVPVRRQPVVELLLTFPKAVVARKPARLASYVTDSQNFPGAIKLSTFVIASF